jgi:hypothetical protein
MADQKHADADRQQQSSQDQRSGCLIAMAPVMVVVVGGLTAVLNSDEDHKVRYQIRQGMDAVGDEALRSGDNPGGNLGYGQADIDGAADPSAALRVSFAYGAA